jgi:hypothetical protein
MMNIGRGSARKVNEETVKGMENRVDTINTTRSQLNTILNSPGGVNAAAIREIKELFITVLKLRRDTKTQGRDTKAYCPLKPMANQIINKINIMPNQDPSRLRLIEVLRELNQDTTPHKQNIGNKKLSLAGQVLTQEMMDKFKLSDADMPPALEKYIQDSPEAELEDRKAVVAMLRDPAHLASKDVFFLFNLKNLTSLPEGFAPQGAVHVTMCCAFTGFPEGFAPQGAVTVADCAAFTGFPEGFAPQGEVYVTGCAAFTGFPEGFAPQGVVTVADCAAFTGFPKDFNPSVKVKIKKFKQIYHENFRMKGYHPKFKKFHEWANHNNRSFIPIKEWGHFIGYESSPLPPKTEEI